MTITISQETLNTVGEALDDSLAVRISRVKNGYDVASHAYRWIDYQNMPPRQEKAYIKKGIEAIAGMRRAAKGKILWTSLA